MSEPVATPKWSPNFTTTPNVLLDELMPHLEPAKTLILLFVTRKTYGWQHPEGQQISIRDMAAGLPYSERALQGHVAALVEIGILDRQSNFDERGGQKPNTYALNTAWQIPEDWPPRTNGGAESVGGGMQSLEGGGAPQFTPPGESGFTGGVHPSSPPLLIEKEMVPTTSEKNCMKESRQAGSSTHHARTREEACLPDPTACLPAFSATNSPTGTGTPNEALEVVDTPCAHAHAPAHAREASEGALLLMQPVAQGGAGFDSLEIAERIARGREPALLRAWIRRAKKRKAKNVAGFIIGRIDAGDAPPEEYLREVKASFQGGGGIFDALGLGNAIGSSPAPQGVRQEAGPPPSWDEPEDEDEEPEEDVPRKAPPKRAEPKPAYFEKWRGHA